MFLLRVMASYCRLSAKHQIVGGYVRGRLPEISRSVFGGGQRQGFGQLLLLPRSTLPYLASSSSRYCSSISGRTASIVQCTTTRKEEEGCGGGSTPPVESQPPPSPTPANSQFTSLINWGKWIIGWLLSSLPFWKQRLSQIEDNVEVALDVAETVVNAVESVANVVEDVSSEIADWLPEEGKLKDVLEKVEEFSKVAVEDLEKAKEVIHKVDDFREGVETLLDEPTIEALMPSSRS